MRQHSIQDGEHLDTCWCHYEQKPASDHAAVKEAHRKFTERLIFASMSSYAKAAQLLADFARDERVKEAELWKRRVGSDSAGYGISTAKWTHERIAQLKRGEV